jgi:hypothetical protein
LRQGAGIEAYRAAGSRASGALPPRGRARAVPKPFNLLGRDEAKAHRGRLLEEPGLFPLVEESRYDREEELLLAEDEGMAVEEEPSEEGGELLPPTPAS